MKKIATGYTFLDPKGRIIVNSIRSTPSETRLVGGEGKVYKVMIIADSDEIEKVKTYCKTNT